MKRQIAIATVCLAMMLPLSAQKKEGERLAESATVLQSVLAGDLPVTILNKADCVVVYPNVRKVAVGIGGSYGRGVLVCRNGANMNGSWGAPAMYSLDQGSIGVQLGSTSTDFVLVIMSQKGAEQILNGKTKLGSDAAAAAGPTGAAATSYNADAMKADVLTYSRSKGLFAGVSLTGASMDTDNDANKSLYGKEISAKRIVSGGSPIVPAAKPLVDLLNQTSRSRR
ncbi:MAG TPA: lipid-binding SYLF domain-containing protein [Bryobacteraceae bacterium]|jgi:lipid-binding SYLF domain-containing protein|nr:lipid-binding SYLF domain-containing protein [Bryobacteraceae bacterium]